MPIEDVIAKFPNVRKIGRGWISDCPLHPEDESPLRIRFEYGQIELECRNHCPDQKIAAAVGLTMADLTDFDDLAIPEDEDEDEFENGAAPTPADEEDEDDDEDEPWFYGWHGEKIRSNYYDEGPVPVRQAKNKGRTVPPKLFGEFWLQGELCILFADTGKGKSILAVQIADSITRGVALAPLALEVPAQRVLYFDYELSDTMFDSRYSRSSTETGEFIDLYPFSMEFRRATPSMDPGYPAYYDTFKEYLDESFVKTLERSKAKVMIVDNITFLSNRTNERAGGAFRLIAALRQLKHEHGLSILALAHTPKRRYSRGLTVNDLQGSKMLSNFADNVFAIGESSLGEDIRYLKQIKPRNTELVYGASNVPTFRIRKKNNFLGFEFKKFANEREHLDNPLMSKEAEHRILVKKVLELRAEGHSIRQIARILGISKSTVSKILRENSD